MNKSEIKYFGIWKPADEDSHGGWCYIESTVFDFSTPDLGIVLEQKKKYERGFPGTAFEIKERTPATEH